MKVNGLIPMLPVKNLSVSLDFYQKLGFTVEHRHDDWGWAMLRCGDSRLMLDQSINIQPNAARQSVIYLYPEDVMDYHDRVRKSGVVVPDLEITFYGLTEFRINDPDGNRLWIGQNTTAIAAVSA